MQRIASIAVALMGLLHVYIMVLEMFFWNTAYGMRVFGIAPQLAADSVMLAANQGLYNGFLAAGLFWGLMYSSKVSGYHIQLFFLACIFVAGIYGAVTAKFSILFVQTVPAAIVVALVVVAMQKRHSHQNA